MSRNHNILTLLLPLFITAAPASYALPEDAQQELIIQSEQAEMDRKTGIVVYQGSVVLTQGTLRIESDRLTITRSGNILEQAIAEGNPARYQQQITADTPETQAEGKRIEYRSQKKEVVVTGNARLRQGGDLFSGEKLLYDMTRETVNASGGVRNSNDSDTPSRIKMVIQPQSDETDKNTDNSTGTQEQPSPITEPQSSL